VWGSGGIATPILTSALDGDDQLHASAALTPVKEHPVPIAEEAGWVPEPVWMLWRREKSYPAGNRTPTVQPVARFYIGSVLFRNFLQMAGVTAAG
jgi:hypothetical protein